MLSSSATIKTLFILHSEHMLVNSLRIKTTVNKRKIQQTLGPWLSHAFSMWGRVITSRHECMYVTLYLWVLRVFASSHWQSMSQNYPRTINIFNFPFYHMIAVITLCWNVARLYTRVLYMLGIIYITDTTFSIKLGYRLKKTSLELCILPPHPGSKINTNPPACFPDTSPSAAADSRTICF